jgi:hypothetical protein
VRQADELRHNLASLTSLATADLAQVWRQVKTADDAKAALNDVLPQLLVLYGSAAGAVAADWYDELRESEEIKGRFRAIVAELPADMGAAELAAWGVGPLFSAEPDFTSAQTLVAGGAQRRILNVARATITGSSIADPQAGGWQRIGSGECAFCRMLIGRGAVYTEATADFASHDHCRCTAVPVFDGKPRPVKPYTPSLRGTSKADQARAKRWIAENL